MDRFCYRLATETFHLSGYEGPVQHELLWYARPWVVFRLTFAHNLEG